MSEDDLLKACAKVGRFLYEFALVEREIDEGIIKILELKGGAADVVASGVDFFRKLNLLRTVALETAPDAEKDGIGKLFSSIAERNNDRVLMAHSTFAPAADDAVQFWRTVAKDGKIKRPDPLWTKEKFDDSYRRLQKIRERLTELRPRLTIVVGDEGNTEILSHYLYSSDSTWAPPSVSS